MNSLFLSHLFILFGNTSNMVLAIFFAHSLTFLPFFVLMTWGNQPNQQAMIGSSKVLAMEDTSNSFYLHNGDHLGLLLVSHHLTRSNYNT